jgi:hypothetical protein
LREDVDGHAAEQQPAGKEKVVIVSAIAREMVGFLWAIARQVQVVAMA